MSNLAKRRNLMKTTSDHVSWSDDKVELLLNVAIDYKDSKSMENINWESQEI